MTKPTSAAPSKKEKELQPRLRTQTVSFEGCGAEPSIDEDATGRQLYDLIAAHSRIPPEEVTLRIGQTPIQRDDHAVREKIKAWAKSPAQTIHITVSARGLGGAKRRAKRPFGPPPKARAHSKADSGRSRVNKERNGRNKSTPNMDNPPKAGNVGISPTKRRLMYDVDAEDGARSARSKIKATFETLEASLAPTRRKGVHKDTISATRRAMSTSATLVQKTATQMLEVITRVARHLELLPRVIDETVLKQNFRLGKNLVWYPPTPSNPNGTEKFEKVKIHIILETCVIQMSGEWNNQAPIGKQAAICLDHEQQVLHSPPRENRESWRSNLTEQSKKLEASALQTQITGPDEKKDRR